MLLMACAVVVTGCPQPPHPPTPIDPWSEIDPVTGRKFWIYVPTTYRHDRAMPLIVSCHGSPPFDVAEHHVREWKWLAERYGCIAVAPSMVGTDGILGAGPVSAMLANEDVILSVISSLGYRYNIDRANIMITGFSGGGFPTYWVGLRHPEIFSVIVARSCNFNRGNLDGWFPRNAAKRPILVYWGENEPSPIVYQSERAVAYLRSRGYVVDTQLIPGISHTRRPKWAMAFFLKNLRPPRPSLPTSKKPTPGKGLIIKKLGKTYR